MTDGIIQKVFKKFANPTLTPTEREIQQELIDKIKQECANTGLHNHWIDMKTLIGDNK